LKIAFQLSLIEQLHLMSYVTDLLQGQLDNLDNEALAQVQPAERLQLISDNIAILLNQLDDDEDDEELIREVMETLANTPEDAWIAWEDVKAELIRAEAAGELPP